MKVILCTGDSHTCGQGADNILSATKVKNPNDRYDTSGKGLGGGACDLVTPGYVNLVRQFVVENTDSRHALEKMQTLNEKYGYPLDEDGALLNKELVIENSWDMILLCVGERPEAAEIAIYLDGKLILTLYDRELECAHEFETPVPVRKGASLDILVENMGRVNYSFKLEQQRKGIDAGVVINDHQRYGWDMTCLDEKAMRELVTDGSACEGVPSLHKLTFQVDEKADTWLELPGWGKGTVLLNGFTLGRFWEIGPQKRLYIPAPLLKTGKNTLRIVETEGHAGKALLLDEPDLG